VRVLSLVHETGAPSGVFGDAVREAGHELVEWNVTEEQGAPFEPDAVVVLGGPMHVDQEDTHGWLRQEDALLRRWFAEGVPLLGVCLGGQLLAKALDSPVRRMATPEIGWSEVELTREAGDDPVFAELPERFEACQWHSYSFELPLGAVPLAANARCLQAFRAGDSSWGLQFHAEVTGETLAHWIENSTAGPFDPVRLRAESRERIDRWNEIGKQICTRFLEVAGATPAAATIRATSRGS
jgi:GMP synthase (glutamine-hydrolysing)